MESFPVSIQLTLEQEQEAAGSKNHVPVQFQVQPKGCSIAGKAAGGSHVCGWKRETDDM